jgi:hypothetical protein
MANMVRSGRLCVDGSLEFSHAVGFDLVRLAGILFEYP